MSNICILPMKSDSKRIPMKLFKEFCGKPLYEHVLEEVNKCPMIDKVYISTPDEWFINYFKDYNRKDYNRIKFIHRPKELAGDVELTEVLKHAAKEIVTRGGVDYEDSNIIQIQLNKPLTKASDIMECIKVFEDGDYDSLSTVQEIGTVIVGEHLESSRLSDAKYKSQAICKIWRYGILMNSVDDYSYGRKEKHCYHKIAKHHIEIDDMEDWRMAEALYKAGY